jgi:hypothetical protein
MKRGEREKKKRKKIRIKSTHAFKARSDNRDIVVN